ncbi:SDR family NAD(P)-dependent oxidoreductase [Paracoccus laeviglucosivorans]|uniref:Short-chain dehydrogenase n=1 Tax=Paracoccus laeviglucosivorans TaxID=1197861 RepID=A0A521FCX2_9RHOB|nr:SDR family NAD(P)-dependent oxidoreductase [Paracoccus laeviglucosivorans]SMO94033.1 Short-chain dehydrogenase [Paracoccus laeviglucosivorans]
MTDFAGKRIWIIGASSGIGEALARAFAAEGARLILSARNEAALDELAEKCGGARVIALDLGQSGALADAISRLDPDPLDAVICTAAMYEPTRVAAIDPAVAEQLVRVNVLGMIEVGRLCPKLLRNGGQLVLFGSVAGYVGLRGGQPYSATKAAVNNLAETLAVELSPAIDVRLVCPGFVRSRLTDKNDFKMPAIISADEAASHVLRGLKRRGFEIHFPRRFTLAMKLLRMLPYALSLKLTRRLG